MFDLHRLEYAAVFSTRRSPRQKRQTHTPRRAGLPARFLQRRRCKEDRKNAGNRVRICSVLLLGSLARVRYAPNMPRRLRIEYEGAIYHVIARGNARQDIVHDDDDRRRLLDDLERVVGRAGWDLLSFVVLSNVSARRDHPWRRW